MSLHSFIEVMPKVELHVHLEGAIQPRTLLELARRNGESLPVDTEAGLNAWYQFNGFPHFVEVYIAISKCIKTADDVELIAREFLAAQAAQHILYSEVTITAYSLYQHNRITFRDTLAALNRAAAWAERAHDTRAGWVIDIAREMDGEESIMVADWAIEGMGSGVVALGLGGYEVGNPPEKHVAAFRRAHAAGLPSVPHAGETMGPDSIWGALDALGADRIGHGVRCLEDAALVGELRARQIPLEVCPISNVCLGVAPTLAAHPLPRLLAEGLDVTLGSDDPPLFNTSLTREYQECADAFGFDADTIERLALNGVNAALLPDLERAALRERFARDWAAARSKHLAGL